MSLVLVALLAQKDPVVHRGLSVIKVRWELRVSLEMLGFQEEKMALMVRKASEVPQAVLELMAKKVNRAIPESMDHPAKMDLWVNLVPRVCLAKMAKMDVLELTVCLLALESLLKMVVTVASEIRVM